MGIFFVLSLQRENEKRTTIFDILKNYESSHSGFAWGR